MQVASSPTLQLILVLQPILPHKNPHFFHEQIPNYKLIQKSKIYSKNSRVHWKQTATVNTLCSTTYTTGQDKRRYENQGNRRGNLSTNTKFYKIEPAIRSNRLHKATMPNSKGTKAGINSTASPNRKCKQATYLSISA